MDKKPSSTESSFTHYIYIDFSEYAVACLGSAEAGLVATTVNPSFTSEEISRHMLSCQPKAIVCMTDNINVVMKACTLARQTDIKLITVRSVPNSSKPSETICFNELMNTDGKEYKIH